MEAKLAQVKDKHEREKAAAMAEFKKFKESVGAREEKIRGEYLDKGAALREEVLAVKTASQEVSSVHGCDHLHPHDGRPPTPPAPPHHTVAPSPTPLTSHRSPLTRPRP